MCHSDSLILSEVCRADVNFEIKTPGEDAAVGRITKQSVQGLEGLATQMFTNADNFCCQCAHVLSPF